MKRYGSVFLLLIRSSLYKVLCLILILGIAEGITFYFVMTHGGDSLQMGELGDGSLVVLTGGLEAVLERSGFLWFFRAALVAAAVILVRACGGGESKVRYTIGRLRIHENHFFLCQGIWNSMTFWLLWTAQVFIVIGLSAFYGILEEKPVMEGQTLFLLFYRSGFLHSLFPLGEMSRHVSVMTAILGLGFSAAQFSWCQRRERLGIGLPVILIATLFLLPMEAGNGLYDGIYACVAIILTLYAVSAVWRKEEEAV